MRSRRSSPPDPIEAANEAVVVDVIAAPQVIVASAQGLGVRRRFCDRSNSTWVMEMGAPFDESEGALGDGRVLGQSCTADLRPAGSADYAH